MHCSEVSACAKLGEIVVSAIRIQLHFNNNVECARMLGRMQYGTVLRIVLVNLPYGKVVAHLVQCNSLTTSSSFRR